MMAAVLASIANKDGLICDLPDIEDLRHQVDRMARQTLAALVDEARELEQRIRTNTMEPDCWEPALDLERRVKALVKIRQALEELDVGHG